MARGVENIRVNSPRGAIGEQNAFVGAGKN